MDTVSLVAPASQELTFFDLIMKGGVVMIPLVILSIFSVYVMVQRYLYLRKAARITPGFMERIKGALCQHDVKSAKAYASAETSAMGPIVLAGLDSIGRPVKEIETMLESAANIEIADMERTIGYLGIIAGVAPMLGFIGTISGIIRIFYNISLTDNISIGIIAGGLYEKMITSGAGLVIGVISYAAYHLLQQRINRFVLYMQKDVFVFMRMMITPTA